MSFFWKVHTSSVLRFVQVSSGGITRPAIEREEEAQGWWGGWSQYPRDFDNFLRSGSKQDVKQRWLVEAQYFFRVLGVAILLYIPGGQPDWTVYALDLQALESPPRRSPLQRPQRRASMEHGIATGTWINWSTLQCDFSERFHLYVWSCIMNHAWHRRHISKICWKMVSVSTRFARSQS